MAKRTQTPPSARQSQPPAASAPDLVGPRLIAFAEQLGRIAGTVQARADGLLDRQALRDQLTRVRDGAADLLNHLGAETSALVAAVSRGRRKTRKPGRTAGAGQKSSAGRSGGKVDAPGKKHRKPVAVAHGVKHSDEMIPKLKAAQAMRRTRRS